MKQRGARTSQRMSLVFLLRRRGVGDAENAKAHRAEIVVFYEKQRGRRCLKTTIPKRGELRF